MADLAQRLSENLARVQARIAAAALRSGRSADAVRLVAVTKYAADEALAVLVAAGCRDLGESRPQQLWQRSGRAELASARWHLIGHLQRNKAPRTVACASLIHSCDSLRLATAIDAAAREQGRTAAVLLEVNIARDPAKHGLAPDEVAPLLTPLAALAHVHVQGLMAMAARADEPDAARADFRNLRQLRDALRANCPPRIALDELSMGMSGDFEVAIEEGATIVRIGSALFEGIAPPESP